MTRDYNVIVPLVLTVALAAGIRRALITENIYTIKLRHRGRPIPTIRHTNMYLVRQARELMSRDFIVLPIDTPVSRGAEGDRRQAGAHIIVSDGPRIAGVARLDGRPYAPDRYAGETLRVGRSDEFRHRAGEPHPQHDHLPHEPARAALAIVVNRPSGVPRPEDVVGVIAATEIANAVIANHYS